MKACTNRMGSLQVQGASPCPHVSQLSGRGCNLRERYGGGSESVSLTFRGGGQSNYVDSRVNLVKTFSFIKTDTSSRSQNGSSKQNGRNGGQTDSTSRRKSVIDLQTRVQDALNNESRSLVKDTEEEGGRRARGRPRKQPTGERRRRVQVVGNNGFVDLETQLGLVPDEDSFEGYNSDSDGVRTSREEEDRRLLESTLKGMAQSELQRRQSNAEASGESGISAGAEPVLESARNLLYSGSRSGAVPAGPAEEILDVEVASQLPSVSYKGESKVSKDWVLNGFGGPRSLAELPGGRRVVELVAAWDGLAGRLPPEIVRSDDSDLLLRALKLTVIALQGASTTADEDGRTPLVRALAVAHTLVDLGMDAEVICTGLLKEVVDSGLVSYSVIEQTLGGSIPRLLHDCSRVRHIPSRVETLDEENSKALRQFCLAFHDVRAVVVELASRLDTMRHVHSLPRYRQQILALETMQIYAPLAHAIGTGSMSLELEDLGFRVLFPDSYSSIENWLRSHWEDGNDVVDECKEQLIAALEQDEELQELVEKITVTGRYKSRFSTMRKLLRDGRKPEEVFDVLGLRVILEPKTGFTAAEERQRGVLSCYKAMEVATTIWKEIPGRLKDYIAEPKQNGYQSLHFAVHLCDQNDLRPPMEIQIRTAEMDADAVAGQASHSLYKGGLTDPDEVKNLKLIMVAAANAAAKRFGEIASNAVSLEAPDPIVTENDQIFKMFDKNQDGVISVDEFRDVIHELGADKEDAVELMRIVDLNTDGSVSAEEFGKFRHQIKIALNLAGADRKFSSQLGTKLPQRKEVPSETLRLSSGGLADSESGADICSPVERVEASDSGLRFPTQVELLTSDEPVSNPLSVPGEDRTMEPSEDTTVFSSAEETETTSSTELAVTSNSNLNGNVRPSRSKKQNPSLVKPVRLPEKPASPTSVQEKEGGAWSEVLESVSYLPGSVKNAVLDEVQVPFENETQNIVIQQELSAFRQLLASGDKESARRIITKLCKDHPESIDVMLHRASFERKCGDMVAAGGLYAKAIRMFKLRGDLGVEYVRSLQAWGTLEAHLQNPERARYLFTESLDASQRGELGSSLRAASVYCLHSWAMLEERVGNWGKARSLLQRAADLEPGNAVVHQTRARLEARAHNYSAARANFKLAVEAAPEDPVCWHAWGMFEGSQKKWNKMRQLFGRALEVDPRNTHTLQAWAHLEGRNKTEESVSRARNLYKKCSEIDPNSVHCWQSWALLEQECGAFDEARSLFERGLGVNPESVPCLQAYAHMERKLGNYESARRLLLVALAVEPENAAALMELGLVEDSLGNAEVALELYQQAAIIDKKKSRVKRRIFESRKKEFASERTPRKKERQSPSFDDEDRAWRSTSGVGTLNGAAKTSVGTRSTVVPSERTLRLPLVTVTQLSER
ncbi:hypothetical protein R1sor_003890 [Riccia sorocarpa]|uniref:EF-hand domain-containing protein n=1 Tax=Riccia sorocarpa TaxID=122646 RepID=A0ABD3H3Q0_9MARC